MTELEELVDSIRAVGAVCDPSIVTSSPVTWREMLPPMGQHADGARGARRGRSAGEGEEADEAPALPRRRGPGRPRRIARTGA
jgi:hypothetical protein